MPSPCSAAHAAARPSPGPFRRLPNPQSASGIGEALAYRASPQLFKSFLTNIVRFISITPFFTDNNECRARFIPGIALTSGNNQSHLSELLELPHILEGLGGVAALAATTELTLVHVVRDVTVDAGRQQLEGRRPWIAMTVVAADVPMRADQGKCRGHIMIEREEGPTLGAVTTLASGAEPPLVLGINVATGAFDRCRPVIGRGMARLAGHILVEAFQGKLSLGVVELRDLSPVRLVVTALAFWSQLAFVNVVLLVAGDAGRLHLFRRALAVAGRAFDLLVATSEREPRLAVVIEPRLLPARNGVALLTFGPEIALVHVVLLMTGDAGLGYALVLLAGMTSDARHLHMRAFQRELGLGVIERLDAFPAGRVVTALALGAEIAFVPVVLLVTSDAGRRRIAVLELGQMTALALGGLVLACECKVGQRVIEARGIEIDDLRSTADVVGMTRLARLAPNVRRLAVKSALASGVARHGLVAIEAE